MGNTYGRITMMLLMIVALTALGFAARRSPTCGLPSSRTPTVVSTNDLTPYLQAEVNEVAMLQAQSNCLQQQGDPLGAALVASYIPDHQMQINALSAAITASGGNPAAVTPNNGGDLHLGTRDQVVSYDISAHQRVVSRYAKLAAQTTDPSVKQIALMGEGAAARHFSSLQVAQAATSGSASQMQQGLLASLTLERGVMNDIQLQAAQLRTLGDNTDADTLVATLPQHQTTADQLTAMLTQIGADPSTAVPGPTVAFTTQNDILLHERVVNTQLVNTYALPIASAPANSPLRNVAVSGQQVALVALNRLQPTTTASLPVTTMMVPMTPSPQVVPTTPTTPTVMTPAAPVGPESPTPGY